jgi:hypothetical protein
VAAFVVGLPWGVFGVSAAYAITVFILAPIGLLIGFRLIGLPLTGYLRRLAPIVLNTVVMASCAAVVLVLVGDRSPGLQIAAATVTGLVVYGLGLVVLRPGALADTRVVLHRGV